MHVKNIQKLLELLKTIREEAKTAVDYQYYSDVGKVPIESIIRQSELRFEAATTIRQDHLNLVKDHHAKIEEEVEKIWGKTMDDVVAIETKGFFDRIFSFFRGTPPDMDKLFEMMEKTDKMTNLAITDYYSWDKDLQTMAYGVMTIERFYEHEKAHKHMCKQLKAAHANEMRMFGEKKLETAGDAGDAGDPYSEAYEAYFDHVGKDLNIVNAVYDFIEKYSDADLYTDDHVEMIKKMVLFERKRLDLVKRVKKAYEEEVRQSTAIIQKEIDDDYGKPEKTGSDILKILNDSESFNDQISAIFDRLDGLRPYGNAWLGHEVKLLLQRLVDLHKERVKYAEKVQKKFSEGKKKFDANAMGRL